MPFFPAAIPSVLHSNLLGNIYIVAKLEVNEFELGLLGLACFGELEDLGIVIKVLGGELFLNCV